jgi:hypothetical protein
MNSTAETLEAEMGVYVVIMFINKLWVMKLYTSRLILELTVRCNVITGYAIPYI